jgi:hypothetical protein
MRKERLKKYEEEQKKLKAPMEQFDKENDEE